MFFLYILIGIILLFFITLCFLSIEFKLENFRFSLKNIKGRHINEDYRIEIILKLFSKIRIYKKIISKSKLEKNNVKFQLKKLEKKMKNNTSKIDIKILKVIMQSLKIKLRYITLKVNIGTSDAAITAIITGAISGLIGIFLTNIINLNKLNYFEVTPNYNNTNLFKVELNCIFELKLIHIIYTICNLRKKGEENGRASNRRTYAYSNE